MILRISLRHWRSYDSLDLTLSEGTTFVVAPNGVGKTSLVFGLAWGVFGDRAGIEPRQCIRAGADQAEVSVGIRLTDGRELTITRVVGRRGRPKVTGAIGEQILTGDEVERLLEESFQVDIPVAARLSLMLGAQHLSSEAPLDLKSHLHKAFGVEEVLRAAEVTQRMAKDAAKRRSAVREHEKRQTADRMQLEEQIANLTAELSELIDSRATLEAKVRAALDDRERALDARTKAEAHSRYEADVRLMTERAREVLRVSAADGADLNGLLEAHARDTAERLVDVASAVAAARATAAAASEALNLLSGPIPICPTCLKQIEGAELAAARDEHSRRLSAAKDELEVRAVEESALQEQARAASEVKRQIERLLEAAPEGPAQATAPDAVAVEQPYETASRALAAHDQHIGALEERLRLLRAEVDAAVRAEASDRELRIAYRREAIYALASAAFGKAAKEILDELIEPIATEVRFRWKALFPVGGLTLRSDGTIVRTEAGEELPWECLSDGERIWARIVTHLLVVTSSTKIPFVWFDEPLEHLDPQLRHAVAATLGTATEGGRPAQILVTTYENQLARQLAEDTDDVALVNVRTETV